MQGSAQSIREVVKITPVFPNLLNISCIAICTGTLVVVISDLEELPKPTSVGRSLPIHNYMEYIINMTQEIVRRKLTL